MRKTKGLSLLEILVAIIIVSIIAASVSAAVIGGYYMLKQAEHKSRAMSIAHVKLQEFLAKGYSNLTANKDYHGTEKVYSGNETDISPIFETTRDNTEFSWYVNVSNGSTNDLPIASTTGSAINIPCKYVEVFANYTEKNIKNKIVDSKSVRLFNVVPYPQIHVLTGQGQFFTAALKKKHKAPKTNGKYSSGWSDSDYHWKNITSPATNVTVFRYPVAKNFVLMYNLAISYDTDNTPLADDTVFTRCLIDGHPKGLVTRTPIESQIFINNIVEVSDIHKSNVNRTISIEWAKEGDTDVYLREFDVSVLAVENR